MEFVHLPHSMLDCVARMNITNGGCLVHSDGTKNIDNVLATTMEKSCLVNARSIKYINLLLFFGSASFICVCVCVFFFFSFALLPFDVIRSIVTVYTHTATTTTTICKPDLEWMILFWPILVCILSCMVLVASRMSKEKQRRGEGEWSALHTQTHK